MLYMIRGRRARRRFLFLAVAASLLVVGTATFFVMRGAHEPDETVHRTTSAAISSGTLRLAFNLPCAIYAGDAERAYAAVRQRDKKTLMDMVTQRRLLMVRQGTAITVSPIHELAVVNVAGDTHPERACYIPKEMISVIQ
jgi:hypothetical protein